MKRLDLHVHCDSNDPVKLDILANACRQHNTIAAIEIQQNYKNLFKKIEFL